MGYVPLEKENLPEILRVKSKWASCLVITSGFLIMTLSAITIGAIFGYTYCYIEHRCAKRVEGYYNLSSDLQIYFPYPDSEEARYNRTINGAIMSSVLVSKILKLGHGLWNNTIGYQTVVPSSNATMPQVSKSNATTPQVPK